MPNLNLGLFSALLCIWGAAIISTNVNAAVPNYDSLKSELKAETRQFNKDIFNKDIKTSIKESDAAMDEIVDAANRDKFESDMNDYIVAQTTGEIGNITFNQYNRQKEKEAKQEQKMQARGNTLDARVAADMEADLLKDISKTNKESDNALNKTIKAETRQFNKDLKQDIKSSNAEMRAQAANDIYEYQMQARGNTLDARVAADMEADLLKDISKTNKESDNALNKTIKAETRQFNKDLKQDIKSSNAEMRAQAANDIYEYQMQELGNTLDAQVMADIEASIQKDVAKINKESDKSLNKTIRASKSEQRQFNKDLKQDIKSSNAEMRAQAANDIYEYQMQELGNTLDAQVMADIEAGIQEDIANIDKDFNKTIESEIRQFNTGMQQGTAIQSVSVKNDMSEQGGQGLGNSLNTQVIATVAIQPEQGSYVQQNNAQITSLNNQIQRYADVIQNIEAAHKGEKLSVWKNAEGKFNTSRLLSDSIAGVALGTVGGLVVNKLVKDHHVETGFEEIVCVIDGEQIASYDEEFVISGAVNKAGCIGNNASYGNTYVWASRTSGGTNYSTMIEDVNNPENNACWIRVDIGTTNNKIKVSDIPSRWFMVGQQVNCGSWADYDTLHERVLDARKSGRTWATVGGAVGGAGLGVGIMELFGNRLIGGKVMGQKSLDEVELLYSQMTTTERAQYEEAITELGRACDELHALGGVHSACGD